jgi:hypothetical protein
MTHPKVHNSSIKESKDEVSEMPKNSKVYG